MDLDNKIFDDLAKLVSIDSVSNSCIDSEPPFGESVQEALNIALEICSSYGFRTKNCNNKIGYAEVGQGDEIMGILVHLDVVPAGDGWTHSPFDLIAKDGKLYGRGVIDDKGPAVAVIHALKEILESNLVLNKRVRIIFGLSEETGEWDDISFYNNTEEPVSFGFTPDADFPAIYCEMGIGNIKFTFKKYKTQFEEIKGGNAINMVPDYCFAKLKDEVSSQVFEAHGKSAHGSTPWKGTNAIMALMNEVPKTNSCILTDFFKLFVNDELNGKSLGGFCSDKESGEITYNHSLIYSDDNNIYLETDVRYPISYTLEEITDNIRNHLSNNGFNEFELSITSDSPFVYLDKEGEVIQQLLKAYQENTNDYNNQPASMGGGTYARSMKNIVAFGPILPGRDLTEHQPDENISIDDFILAKNIYKSAIINLAVDK